MKRKRLLVMGFMGSIPIAGVIWQHIHYIVGLQRLGHDVYYIEDSGRHPYDAETLSITTNVDYAVKVLSRLAREFNFEDRWAFCARYLPENPCTGLSFAKVHQLYRDADAILNICGSQEFNDELLANERIIYVESDPGLEQIRVDQGNRPTIASLRRHHRLFSFGENVGTKEFPVPSRGLKWLPTRQPVVTDFWKTDRAPKTGAVFTTVANWTTGGLKDVEWRGEKYDWSKAKEFRRFVAAPQRAGETFELTTDMKNPRTRALFERNGWRMRVPYDVSADYHLYRTYLQESKGEFTVAKDQYVRLNTGWFSDRSACYLAAGRPVITQQTGFSKHYPTGAGLFAYDSLGEIAEAVREINADYRK